MENYDAIVENKGNQNTQGMSTEEWAAARKQERADLYVLADRMADKALSDPKVLSSYLTLQARLGRSSLNNTLLVLAQKPEATYVRDAETWQDRGRSIRKGEGKKAIKQFQQDKEYTRSDGSLAMGYKVVRCFDVSQTYGKPVQQRAALGMSMKSKLKALMTDTPVPVKLSDNIPPYVGARYSEQENVIHVARGLEANALFFSVAREMVRADGCSDTFLCDCAANIACVRFGIEPKFNDRIPNEYSSMGSEDKKSILGDIRESADGIVSRVDRNLYAERQQQKNAPVR